ncbi:proton-conducting transporter membrane subunit [Natronomonas amylolytica]|uniref:proton-conducting transporter transmembrane domain-containing protein n=1 Tax=Natronomonas amylolytica TaxID=3108498 RepID=UPI00300960D9
MTEQSHSNDAVQLPETPSQTSVVPRASTWGVWALFVACLGILSLSVWRGYEWAVPGYVVIDGLTMLMWVVISFFSGIVHSYSRRYMAGDSHIEGFFGRVLFFTLAVMVMTAADHALLFVAAWLAMGLTMASLIGHVRGWEQAQAAASMARRYFLVSSGLVAVGLTTLVWTAGTTSLTGILGQADSLPPRLTLLAVAALALAAICQSALFPFHNWLLSSMTAPTPASALMHAGFVNAGGILLTRFAPLFAEDLAVMSAIVVVGAVSALLGQALLLVQPDIKRKLGASTVAQMGFMILQCGLGFFAAAITHLILHGFYKAYLFLSSGATVEGTAPTDSTRASLGLLGLGVSLLTAVGGGVLFTTLTGKGLKLDSSVVLTLVVVLTTLHAARDILRRSKLSPPLRLVSVPLVVMAAIGVYSVMFNSISALLSSVPMTTAPTELTVVHGAVAAVFAAAYLATELGWHRSSRRLYVALLNLSQPNPDTVLTRKEDYNDA